MTHLHQYCKQIFDTSFHRKSNIDILNKVTQENSSGLFFSIFKTDNHKIQYEPLLGINKEINYKMHHLFIGNDSKNIFYIVISDLPYEYQNVTNKQTICHFSDLNKNLQTKLVVNLEQISLYEGTQTLEKIKKIAQQRTTSFIFNEEDYYFNQLNKIFIQQKLCRNLKEKIPILKNKKI